MTQMKKPVKSEPSNLSLRIYYDGQCPLCNAEIDQLKALNKNGRLAFADLNDKEFIHQYPHIDPQQAQRILHGETADGTIITGLDVTCMAWHNVGKHRWLAILRWPLIRHIADLCYLFFARHRQKISSLLMRRHTQASCRESSFNETSCRQCR